MKKRYLIIGIVIIIIVAIRLYLPFFVRNQVNNQINEMEGFSGGVERVSMQLVRGSVQLHELSLYADAAPDPSPLIISSHHNDLSISWGALIRGRLEAEIRLDSLEVNYYFTELEDVEEEPAPELPELLADLMSFNISIFHITNGRVSLIIPDTDPSLNIFINDLNFETRNISNIKYEHDTLPTTVNIEGQIMEAGNLSANGAVNIMKTVPDFEFEVEFENVNLPQFNYLMNSYAGFNLDQGLFNLYLEAAANQGYLQGYLKPIIEDLEVTPTEERDDELIQEAYETLLDGIGQLLKNPDTENIGTRVEFEGRIDDPDVKTWDAIWTLLRNAFFESVSKGVEDTIDFEELQ